MDGGPVIERMAAVVIGRNEGQLLAASLTSVRAAKLPLVYVDSGSTDRSPAIASSLQVAMVELDSARSFSAARGRNEGVDEALRLWPHTRYVMFLDGDCVLHPDFPSAAAAILETNSECAVVTGHLSERAPEASIYNRLCAIEWRSPVGPMQTMGGLGGIMAVRVSAFRAVGGFNERAIAGEEPDFGVRLRLKGYSLIKIDRSMATHDAQMHRFNQWWWRAVRSGHAMAHRYASHGQTEFLEGRGEVRSAVFWGFLVPVAVLILLGPTRGVSLWLLGGYGLLALRIYRHYRKQGLSGSDARLITRFLIYAKFAEFFGILRYCFNRARGRFEVIEARK
jgi:GT2 family glycosyltransferase